MRKTLLTIALMLIFTPLALADEPEGNLSLNSSALGTKVILEGNKGIVVNPTEGLILLEKSLSRSFDTEARNDYESSPIKQWLNNDFKDTLVNNEWIKPDSISLLSEEEFNSYKNYLSPFAIGWLKEALNPAEEPVDNTPYVENTWNYVKAIMNGEIVGLGYATHFYASPITLELNNAGYKLKNAFGKPRVLIPEDASNSNTGDYSELAVGDKVRFANKWWTLVDTNSRKILGEFDNLSQYVDEEQEIDDNFKYINTYQFSDEVTKYDANNEKSIAYYLKNDFRNSFINKDWIVDINLPTKVEYESSKSLGLGDNWLVYETVEGKEEVYLITPDGLVSVNPGEAYPIRALVKLTEGLFLEDMGNGYFNVTDDDGID